MYACSNWSIKIGVSLVIAFINACLKLALRFTVRFKKHSTHSARERSFAIYAYVAMLVNTVVVLILVNW